MIALSFVELEDFEFPLSLAQSSLTFYEAISYLSLRDCVRNEKSDENLFGREEAVAYFEKVVFLPLTACSE